MLLTSRFLANGTIGGILAATLACAGVACTPPSLPAPARSGEASTPNRDVVDRVVTDVFNAGRYDTADQLFSPPFAQDERTFAMAIRRAFPDLRVALDRVVDGGDWVAIHWTATGTHQGDFAGVPATGRKAVWSGAWFWRVANGRVVEGKELNVWDRQGLQTQLTRTEGAAR